MIDRKARPPPVAVIVRRTSELAAAEAAAVLVPPGACRILLLVHGGRRCAGHAVVYRRADGADTAPSHRIEVVDDWTPHVNDSRGGRDVVLCSGFDVRGSKGA